MVVGGSAVVSHPFAKCAKGWGTGHPPPHCGSELMDGAPALGNFDGNLGNDILHQAKAVALDFKAMELQLE